MAKYFAGFHAGIGTYIVYDKKAKQLAFSTSGFTEFLDKISELVCDGYGVDLDKSPTEPYIPLDSKAYAEAGSVIGTARSKTE